MDGCHRFIKKEVDEDGFVIIVLTERGYGVFLNKITPEKAAQELGSSCRKELAGLVGIV